MMADENLRRLLEDLQNSPEKLEKLTDLKTFLFSIHPSKLQDVIKNISFDATFNILDTDNSERIQVCCDVLERFLSASEATSLLQKFKPQLILGLGHQSVVVQHLCLRQVLHAAEVSPQQVALHSDVILILATMTGDDNLVTAKLASQVFVELGKASDGLELMFQGNVFDKLKDVMSQGDVIRYRVYEVVVNIARLSPEALMYAASSGLLQQLVNEVQRHDILIQLNALELLTELALCEHGLVYMDQQGVVARLENMMADVDADPMMGFLLPGLVKFFGNVAHVHPKEICDRFQHFINMLFQLLYSDDVSLKCVAVETVGFIGSTVEGKLALDKQGDKMMEACKQIGCLLRESPMDVRTRVFPAVTALVQIEVADQTAELLSLTETWFTRLMSDPLRTLMTVATQPFMELRLPVLELFQVMAKLPWGQKHFNDHPGFNEYLLDRSTEKMKEGKEGKFQIVKNLVESPTAAEIYDRVYFMRLREYDREGPFYTKVESSVALEEAT